MTTLILYAVPEGSLGEQIASYFDGIDTEAQSYPPHCTLTGFFHDDDVARYVDAAARIAAPATVRVASLHTEGADWIGLEIDAPELIALTRRFADLVIEPRTRDDAVRVKEWLHVSLAYGHDPAIHGDLAHRALAMVNPDAAVSWSLRLYERTDAGAWTAHGAWPLGG